MERFFSNYTSYEQEEESSSEDELDVNSQNKKELTFEDGDDDSSEDEFEKEMKADLGNMLSDYKKLYTNQVGDRDANMDPIGQDVHMKNAEDDDKTGSKSSKDLLYDSYSDDDGDDQKIDPSNLKSNDDLLYDPHSDDLDKQWVEQQRFRYQPCRSKASTMLPESDAVLNCPCCMSTLCYDCQRHETYHFQYRAMFVTNCKVLHGEIRHCPKKGDFGKTRKRKHQLDKSNDEGDDDFNPVCCSVCDTEVAVFDKEEVFHFFNVLASY